MQEVMLGLFVVGAAVIALWQVLGNEFRNGGDA